MTSEPTAPREENELHGEVVPFTGTPAVPAADTSYEIALDEDPAPAVELVHGGDGSPCQPGPGSGARSSPRTCVPGRGYAAPQQGTAACSRTGARTTGSVPLATCSRRSAGRLSGCSSS